MLKDWSYDFFKFLWLFKSFHWSKKKKKYLNWSNTTWSDLPCFWMAHRSLSLSSLSYYCHDLTFHNLLNKLRRICPNSVFINHNIQVSFNWIYIYLRCHSKVHYYSHFHNTFRFFDVLTNFPFTTSKTMRDYYLKTWYIRVASRYFKVGIHSMQGWTATTRHGVTRKETQKD